MKRAYLYPVSGRYKVERLYNPYLDDFLQSGEKYFEFVNKNNPSKTGFINVTRYMFNLDYVFLNWIEKVPEQKLGLLQSWFVLSFLPLSKLLGIRVIWTMHNKLAHTKEHMKMKKRLFRSLLKHSHRIITHSSEGISFGEEMVKGSSSKIFYLPHPVKDRRKPIHVEKDTDILIWGTMAPYKGIDLFLDYLRNKNLLNKYKILIVGKISSPEYEQVLRSYENNSITIKDAFLSDDELLKLISRSKIVLFTYSKSSILSSGVLMDSLGFGARIVGPNVGAFGDLGKDGILFNYEDFDELMKKLNDQLQGKAEQDQQDRLNHFLVTNSWESFADNMAEKLQIGA